MPALSRIQNLKDAIAVLINLDHALDSHRVINHCSSSKDSLALHLSSCLCHDCIPGETQLGPWVKKNSVKNAINVGRVIAGRFGKIKHSFDKANFFVW